MYILFNNIWFWEWSTRGSVPSLIKDVKSCLFSKYRHSLSECRPVRTWQHRCLCTAPCGIQTKLSSGRLAPLYNLFRIQSFVVIFWWEVIVIIWFLNIHKELHFGVNHLSHYLFVELLKEKLIESAPARVVILSSESHRQPKVTGIKYEELAVESKECSCDFFHIKWNASSRPFCPYSTC